MNDLSKEHTKTYDALADEYESRVESLTTVTKHAVANLSKHLPHGATILELGCGVGLAARMLTDAGFSVTCVELSPKMISYAKKRNSDVRFIQGDFLDVEFADTFDGVFGFAFIHLFPKIEAVGVLKKSHKLLKSGGILYTGTTKSEEGSEGWETKKDYNKKHKRFRKRWTEEEFRNAMEDAGFEIIDFLEQTDPFGKTWIDLVGRKV